MKHKFFYLLLGFIGIFFPLLSCSSDSDSENNDSPRAIRLTAEQQQLSEKLHSYSIKLLSDIEKVNQEDTDLSGNAICSPLGTQIILSMIANGVYKDEQNGILDYLGTDDVELLNSLNMELLKQLPLVDKKVNFNLANALWINSFFNLKLNSDFNKIVTDNYQLHIQEDNFNDNNLQTLERINDWASLMSNGVINSYFSELNPNSLGIFLNALYLKANWAEEYFSKEDTSSQPFFGQNATNDVEMMKSDFFLTRYSNEEKFEYSKIPFGNEGFYMQIILPKEKYTPLDILSTISSTDLKDINAKGDLVKLQLSIPKFNLSSSINISKVFDKLGLSAINSATFDMFESPVKGDVTYRQNNSFSIDEKGTEVASVSSADIGITAPLFDEKKLSLNRPFIFFIRESSTGTILLEGVINDL
ncbi:MAG: hypothetical protein K2M45_04135 [Muribaculaceae bacterium]|nr:hypothetical protein [Muribaculaceae bacterium]